MPNNPRKVPGTDYFEEAKFIVTRNLFILLTVVLLLLGIVNLFQNDLNMIPMIAGGVCSGLVLIVLFASKKYRFAAIFAAIISTLFTIYNLLITSHFGHFIDFFWIVIMALYVFFTLGKKWGVINLFINISVVAFIFYLARNGYIKQYPKELTTFSEINFVINIGISGTIFSYIVILMINQMRLAQERYILANSELSFINEEKTAMLKEIHHRVKNNLQVIMSLLRLQANEVNDANTKFHLTDSVNRVSAMALIHEKMYQSETLAKIDLKIYLHSLIDDLIKSYATKTTIAVNIDSEIENIDPKSIVPIALIFNELVSNSIKHGFDKKESGLIEINIKKSSPEIITISYFDDGNWKDSGDHTNGFGLELIEIFTEQLDGKLSRKIENGTVFNFEFHAKL